MLGTVLSTKDIIVTSGILVKIISVMIEKGTSPFLRCTCLA